MRVIVPKLRFKEFESDWKSFRLNDISIINPKNKILPEKFIYIDLESVNKGILTKKSIIDKKNAPSRAQRTVLLNDILFQTVRPYQQNNYFINELDTLPYIASTGYALIRTSQIPYFIYTILHKQDFLNKVLDMCTGTSFPAINSNDLGTIDIKIPEKEEQIKISNLLSLLDKKIELQKQKTEALKLYKKGLLQKIMNQKGSKIRLKDILIEYSKKTTINNQYEIISSTKEGLFLQKEYFNRSIASENNIGYKILKINQVVLSPQNLWMGNINYNDKYEIGIVSPSYKIFNINNEFDKYYIFNLLKSEKALYYYTISSEQGASIVRRNLNMEAFEEITFNIPDRKIQNMIGINIKLTDSKIKLSESKFNYLVNYKKALLQQMFI